MLFQISIVLTIKFMIKHPNWIFIATLLRSFPSRTTGPGFVFLKSISLFTFWSTEVLPVTNFNLSRASKFGRTREKYWWRGAVLSLFYYRQHSISFRIKIMIWRRTSQEVVKPESHKKTGLLGLLCRMSNHFLTSAAEVLGTRVDALSNPTVGSLL